ncbi:unnamed protein product, partial [Effrenium voratum]
MNLLRWWKIQVALFKDRFWVGAKAGRTSAWIPCATTWPSARAGLGPKGPKGASEAGTAKALYLELVDRELIRGKEPHFLHLFATGGCVAATLFRTPGDQMNFVGLRWTQKSKHARELETARPWMKTALNVPNVEAHTETRSGLERSPARMTDRPGLPALLRMPEVPAPPTHLVASVTLKASKAEAALPSPTSLSKEAPRSKVEAPVPKLRWPQAPPAPSEAPPAAAPFVEEPAGERWVSWKWRSGSAEAFTLFVPVRGSRIPKSYLRPTAFIGAVGIGAGIGAAAGGLGVFMLCNAKCPGGIKGAGILGGTLSALNPLTLLSKKDEKEEKEAAKDPDPQQKLFKQVDYIEKEICNMNCKVAALMGAAAGAVAGGTIAKVKTGGGMAGPLDEDNTETFFVLTKQMEDMRSQVDDAVGRVRSLQSQ